MTNAEGIAMSRHIETTETKPSKIIPFETYHTAMTQPALAHIRSYWESLRAGRLMPLRSEIDPREMSPYLEYCFVLQHRGPADTRFRLAGMGLNDLMGMELRGMPLRSIIEREDRAVFSAQLEQTFEEPEIQEYRLISDQPNQPRLTANMLILPLRSDEANSDRAIGCLVFEGVAGVPPRRFRLEAVSRTSLRTGERNGLPKIEDRQLEPAGFAEDQEAYSTETDVPYLRVVK